MDGTLENGTPLSKIKDLLLQSFNQALADFLEDTSPRTGLVKEHGYQIPLLSSSLLTTWQDST
jgi:hypothetical protein